MKILARPWQGGMRVTVQNDSSDSSSPNTTGSLVSKAEVKIPFQAKPRVETAFGSDDESPESHKSGDGETDGRDSESGSGGEVKSLEVRDYQQRIVKKVLDLYRGSLSDARGNRYKPVQSVLVESPTGSGKTIMGMLIAQQMRELSIERIGWVAMRRNLLVQAQRENDRLGFGLDIRYVSMFDSNPPEVDLVIVDEAQHDAATSMATLHAKMKPKYVLGLSATPFRSDRAKLCFQEVVRDVGIQQLIQFGFLSRYRHFTIPTYTPESVARFFARESARWGKSLIFFHRLEQCLECQRQLWQQGIAAEVVTASTDRERQIEDFEAGRIDVLLSMAILTEGFDCPSLQTVFCRPSSKGPTLQMCGRVFRRHPHCPIKQVVQCAATNHPMTGTADACEQYVWLEGAWKSLTKNPQIDAICQRMRELVIARQPLAKSNVSQTVAAANT
jgi:superfamily II DNA or RNA helicase